MWSGVWSRRSNTRTKTLNWTTNWKVRGRSGGVEQKRDVRRRRQKIFRLCEKRQNQAETKFAGRLKRRSSVSYRIYQLKDNSSQWKVETIVFQLTLQRMSQNFWDSRSRRDFIHSRMTEAIEASVFPQKKCLEWVFGRFEFIECNAVRTPMDAKITVLSDYIRWRRVLFNQSSYQTAIGCLMYASTATSPAHSHAVCNLSQFMSKREFHEGMLWN